MRLYILLTLFVAISCTTVTDREYQRVQTDEYYRDSGAAVYMLPIIPEWRNYSSAGECKRVGEMRYLNIANLMNSFSIDHEMASQIQLAFNRMYAERSQNMQRSPTLKEIEQIFFSANDYVIATGGYLKKPKYKNVNIIWLDSYLNNLPRLQKLMNTKAMLQGRPVFLSTCLTKVQMIDKMKEAGVVYEGSFFVDYQYLTYYNLEGTLTSKETFYLKDFLQSSVKSLKVFTHTIRPEFIKGKYQLKKY